VPEIYFVTRFILYILVLMLPKHWVLAMNFSSFAQIGKMLHFSENGRNMQRSASKEVWNIFLKIYDGLNSTLDDVQIAQKDRSKTIKTPISIRTKSNGCPEIPEITMAQGYKTKIVQAMLRDYCTTHICEFYLIVCSQV
jgi:hypothetical protein